MEVVRTFRFRLYPNRAQRVALLTKLETVRRVWNRSLNVASSHYRSGGKVIGKKLSDTRKALQCERKNGCPRLKSLSSESLRDSVIRLERSYDRFFKGIRGSGPRTGTPKYHRKSRRGSIPFNNSIGSSSSACTLRVESNGKWVPVIGGMTLEDCKKKHIVRVSDGSNVLDLKVVVHRPVLGQIKSSTIVRDGRRWFVAFSCNLGEWPVPTSSLPSVGVDFGLGNFLTMSDGSVAASPGLLTKNLERIRFLSQELSSKQPGSSRYRRIKSELASLHRKIADARKDFHHKLANSLLRIYGTIVVEDLSVASMMQDKKLSRSFRRGLNRKIQDAGWRQFIEILKYKAQACGASIIEVSPCRSSQECSRCGAINPKTLEDRRHVCHQCGLDICRDLNSAIIMCKRGLPDGPWEKHLKLASSCHEAVLAA